MDSRKINLFLVLLALSINNSVCDPRATEAALVCSNRTSLPSDRQVYVATFLAAMDAISPLISRQGYGEVVNGSGTNNTVYVFGECMKDLSRSDCNLCFAQCKTQVLRCLPFQRLIRGGRLFYDGCYLRYDDYMFFNESLSPVDRTVCGRNDFVGNRTLFKQNVDELARTMSLEGPKNDGFFTGSVSRENLTVYGLAQCWEPVSGSSCRNCLAKSVANLSSCPPKDEGRVLNAGCYLRYSTQRFYNNSSPDSSAANGGGSRHLAIILSSTCAAVAFAVIVATIFFFGRKRALKQKREKKQLGSLLQMVNKSNLNFSYESLERATDYFNNANKLGQGGSGSVYKGVLTSGQAVAIKRLFFTTRQWVDHFFNEVNLISGIDHKNLVKLLGCSITGPESLLVYEYMPNQSLHDHLFVKRNVQPLDWQQRYKIILGTAEGLAFLHEESTVRIIHRDIKLSNVLLDEDFAPKIADFGLARLFPEDQSHISTAIAGTLGYMAPEYVVRGKLSEKADVYSYGVLLIEVITGKRNNSVSQNSFSVLQKIWNLYGTSKLREAVDPILQGMFPEEEANRILQIGLLCVQASAETRPSMSEVVKMLNYEQQEIPNPTQPPFLNPTGSSSEMSPLQPAGGTPYFQSDSNTLSSGNQMTQSFIEPR